MLPRRTETGGRIKISSPLEQGLPDIDIEVDCVDGVQISSPLQIDSINPGNTFSPQFGFS